MAKEWILGAAESHGRRCGQIRIKDHIKDDNPSLVYIRQVMVNNLFYQERWLGSATLLLATIFTHQKKQTNFL